MLLPLQAGFWQAELEQQATAILKADRARLTALYDKQDWFTDEQFKLRQDREVYSAHPIDRLIESGLYRRAYNPMAGKRPTSRGRYSDRQDPWRQDGFESFDWAWDTMMPRFARADRLVEGGQHYTWDIMLPHQACRPVVVLQT